MFSLCWSSVCVHPFFSREWWASLWPLLWILYQVSYLPSFHLRFSLEGGLCCSFIWSIFLYFLILLDCVYFCVLGKTAISPSLKWMVIRRLEVCFSLLSVQRSRGGSLPRTSSQIVPLGLRNASPSGHKHPVFKGHPVVYMLGQNHNRGTQDRASLPQPHWVGWGQKRAEEHRVSRVGEEATGERLVWGN